MPRRTTLAPVIELLSKLPATVPECHDLIHQLVQHVSVLQERINLNSRNSSKPPSSDDPATPARQSNP